MGDLAGNPWSTPTTVDYPVGVTASGATAPGALLTLVTASKFVPHNSVDQTNMCGRGIKIGINITAMTATSLTITLQGKDVASGTYYDILASAALVAPGFTLLTVYPGFAAAANVSAPDVLPRTWRVTALVTDAGANTVTATIGASVML